MNTEKISLASELYCPEALKLAAFVMEEKADIKVSPGRTMSEVLISADDARLAAAEFLNEALNQQCRLDLAKTNSKIAGMITTKALLSASGSK